MSANYPDCFMTSTSLLPSSPKEQRGGGSSFNAQFHASTVKGGVHEISRVTAANIANAPMFNPFSKEAVIPTVSTGIVPTGIYLLEQHRSKKQQASSQTGGSVEEKTKDKLATHVKQQRQKRSGGWTLW